MEFGRYLVVNAAHVRCSTAQLFEQCASLPAAEQPLAISPTAYGWFLPTSAPCPRLDFTFPEEIAEIQALGREHGCDYVLLDADGPEIDGLALFPW